MSRFDGKAALVTGAASGIGREIALRLAARGATVFVADLTADAGKRVVEEIRTTGGTASFAPLDVTAPESCTAAVAAVVAATGGLDIAVNSAGIMQSRPATTAEMPAADWQRVLDINLTGVFNCLQPELRAMQGRGGSIVNIASIAGERGIFGSAAYCASKHGVIGLTRTVAMEYGRYGIRANAVCPGYTRTPMLERERFGIEPEWVDRAVRATPLRRMGEPGDVAETVLWLCSAAAGFVTGASFTVDGGLTAG